VGLKPHAPSGSAIDEYFNKLLEDFLVEAGPAAANARKELATAKAKEEADSLRE
jgi:hypothetical protein